MLYQHRDESGHTWHINPGGVMHVVRAHAYAESLHHRSKTTTEALGGDHGLALHYVRTDFTGFHREVQIKTSQRMTALVGDLKHSGADAHGQLVAMRAQTAAFHRELRKAQARAGKAFAAASADYCEVAEMGAQGVRGAMIVRDAMADIDVFCAGLLTGGAAWAGRAAVVLAKGFAKWQDTRNLGDASLEAATTFVPLLVPAGKALKYQSIRTFGGLAEDVGMKRIASFASMHPGVFKKGVNNAIFLVGVALDSIQEGHESYVAGHSIPRSVFDGLAKGLSAGVADKLPGKLHLNEIVERLEHCAIPARIFTRPVRQLVSAAVEKAPEFAIEKGAHWTIEKILEAGAALDEHLHGHNDTVHMAARDLGHHVGNQPEHPVHYVNRAVMRSA